MYKELLASGAFDPPFPPVPAELLQELRFYCSPIAPAPADLDYHGNGDGLRVYYQEKDGQLFWVYDNEGFICSTNSVQVLIILLRAEARPRPDPRRPNVKNGARELIFPGASNTSNERQADLQARARDLAQQMAARRANGPAGTAGSGDSLDTGPGDTTLRTIGLDE